MMLHTFRRVLRFSFENVWRNGWLSVITVSTLVLTLFSVSMVWALQVGIGQVVRAAEDRIDLAVYFFPSVTDEQANSVMTSLRGWPGVRSLTYVTREQALARYEGRAAGESELLKPLEAIGQNPFGASLVIRANSPSDYRRLIAELSKPQYRDLIEGQEKDFEENQAFISGFSAFTDKVRTSGIAASSVFALIAAMLTFNAIRVAIYTHRDEIAIMKLVGASNWFVQAPFLIEAIVYSLAAVIITAALSFVSFYFLQPYLTSYFAGSDVNLLAYFTDHGVRIFGVELAAILIVNTLSGSLALRRYLRV